MNVLNTDLNQMSEISWARIKFIHHNTEETEVNAVCQQLRATQAELFPDVYVYHVCIFLPFDLTWGQWTCHRVTEVSSGLSLWVPPGGHLDSGLVWHVIRAHGVWTPLHWGRIYTVISSNMKQPEAHTHTFSWPYWEKQPWRYKYWQVKVRLKAFSFLHFCL